MTSLRAQILGVLESYGDADDRLITELDGIAAENGDQAYEVIFEVITRLKLDAKKAKSLWHGVVDHRKSMMEALGRNVGFRAVLCDYLCNVNNTLENPMVIEIHVFENHYQSTMYDYLTGLYSRGVLDTIMERELARCMRHDSKLSILFFDLDNFKDVNDTYGHAAGDECLAGVAKIIKKSIRTEDTAVRYGGEEVVVILPQTDKMQALSIGERIRKRVAEACFIGRGERYSITMSGGLVSYPMDGEDRADLLEKADRAMYQAKSAGKNNIVVYSREKRRYVRVDFTEGIQIKPVGFSEDPVTFRAQGRNISTGGLLFESGTFFKIGTKLQLRIPFAHSDRWVEVTGVVVRNELNPDGKFDTGISFLEMEKPDRDEIFSYLKTRLYQFEMAHK